VIEQKPKTSGFSSRIGPDNRLCSKSPYLVPSFPHPKIDRKPEILHSIAIKTFIARTGAIRKKYQMQRHQWKLQPPSDNCQKFPLKTRDANFHQLKIRPAIFF
jgi:hypothetical protein